MHRPELSPAVGYVAYWARARRLEVVAVVLCAAVAAVLWGRELPTRVLEPDLAPEQLVQLFAALQAACVILAVRPPDADVERLASIGMLGRRLGWLGALLAVTAVCTVAAAAAMPDLVGATYLRNVSAYVGIGLALSALALPLGLAAPWLWFALSVTVGRTSQQGVETTSWWAYPLQDPSWHPQATLGLLLMGAIAWAARH